MGSTSLKIAKLALTTPIRTTSQTSTTSSAITSTPTCPFPAGGQYWFTAADSKTPADGTYLQGVNFSPGYLIQFNPAPSNGHGPQFTPQVYTLDFYSGILFDNIYPLCVTYDTADYQWINPGRVGSCNILHYNNDGNGGPMAPLICATDLYQSNLTCTVDAGDKTLDTFYLQVYGNSQILAIATQEEAVAAGNVVTLIPKKANCPS